MYSIHEQITPINNDCILWKYMNFEKFVNMIITNTLWFNRIDSFDDVFEGTYPPANKLLRSKIYGFEFELPVEQMEKLAKNELYVACFHQNNYESAAMWDLYAKHAGIAFKTNGIRLSQSFDNEPRNIYISQVRYIDYNNDFMPGGQFVLLGTSQKEKLYT